MPLALRAEHAKLILTPRNAKEYYLLTNDPWEEHNLAADPKYRARINEMRNLLLEETVKIDHPAVDMVMECCHDH